MTKGMLRRVSSTSSGPLWMRGAEQHGLLLQGGADLAVFQNLLDDVARLVGLVANGDELRPLGRLAFGPEVLGEALRCEIDDAVGSRQDRLGRAIVAVERDDLGRRAELAGEIEDVAHGRGAEGIDRLGVVADDGQAAAARLQRQQDRGLKAIGVLIFVDQDMIEAAADIVGKQRIADGLRPVEQQVVVIENVLRLLGLDIGGEQLAQLRAPAGAPREEAAEHLVERQFGIDGAGVDRKAGALGREPAFRLGEAELVPDEVHQVGAVLAVMDGEGGIEPDLLGIVAQQPRADAVKGAGPGQRIGHDAGIGAEHLRADALDAAGHFGCRPARKGHQQDAARIGAVDDQMADAMRKRIGLARAGAGNDQQRAANPAVGNRRRRARRRGAVRDLAFRDRRRTSVANRLEKRTLTESRFSFCSQCHPSINNRGSPVASDAERQFAARRMQSALQKRTGLSSESF